jgi:hypothetical protein
MAAAIHKENSGAAYNGLLEEKMAPSGQKFNVSGWGIEPPTPFCKKWSGGQLVYTSSSIVVKRS